MLLDKNTSPESSGSSDVGSPTYGTELESFLIVGIGSDFSSDGVDFARDALSGIEVEGANSSSRSPSASMSPSASTSLDTSGGRGSADVDGDGSMAALAVALFGCATKAAATLVDEEADEAGDTTVVSEVDGFSCNE